MRTHQASQKKSSVHKSNAPTSNPLASRPFAVQQKVEESERAHQLKGYESTLSDFAILNPQEGKAMPVQFKLAIGQQVVQRMNAPQKTKETEVSKGQQENKTGLPDNLKGGIETLSGITMDDVKVHYNSSKPLRLQALAYTQGTEIHVASGQEKHLPHEAWHVVQQKQGRVKPTLQMKRVNINDDKGLEKEADVMGEKALHAVSQKRTNQGTNRDEVGEKSKQISGMSAQETIQRLGADQNNSDPVLFAEYGNLLNSATFQKLNQLVTTIRDIILVDSSLIPGQPVDYTAATHTIQVPLNTAGNVARPLADVRDDILWEMHNASIKGALARSGSTLFVPAPSPGASQEKKSEFPYFRAAYALSMEWEEWINIAEHDLRTQAINADPAMVAAGLGLGPHVTRSFALKFAQADQGWYNFQEYLKEQIITGHTISYDANATKGDWEGKKILTIVEGTSNKSLKITQKQVKDWKSKKTKKIKQPNTNPFKSKALIDRVMRSAGKKY